MAQREADTGAAPGGPLRTVREVVGWLRERGVSHVRGLYATLGLALTLALALAAASLWGFVAIADEVADGETLAVDRAILRWVGEHHAVWLDVVAVEVTALGAGVVVVALALVAAAFLAIERRRGDVLTLAAAVAGGFVLNVALKAAFGRTRPDVFEWLVQGVRKASFPSGHALHAAVLFTALACILARQGTGRGARRLLFTVAALGVALVSLSRVYLGVHYPTDVVAGVAVGYAWAMACVIAGRVLKGMGGERR